MEFLIVKDDKKQPDELEHTGVKYMRWYVRRWQLPDGSLTDAGRERYRKMRKEHNWGGSAGSEDEESKEKKKQINAKTTSLFKVIESIEKKWESGEYFNDTEKAGPVAFNKDDQLSARSLEDNIQRILDGKWDGYQDPDMKKAVQLVKELQELGGDPKSFISAYKTAYKKDSSKDKSNDGDQRPYRKEYNPSLTGTGESALASKWKGSSAKTYDDGSARLVRREIQPTKLNEISDKDKEKINAAARKVYYRKNSSGTNK